MDALTVTAAVKEFREGGTTSKALDGVGLSIREGEIVGLLGSWLLLRNSIHYAKRAGKLVRVA